MSIEALKKELGIFGSEIELESNDHDFFEGLADVWNNALEMNLTANDCAVLLAAPFVVEILEAYRMEVYRTHTGGIKIALEGEALQEN